MLDSAIKGVYSGAPGFTNDPLTQQMPFQGPIPEGQYRIGVPFTFHSMPNSMRLFPDYDTTDTFGRFGFLIHGGNASGTGSAGCIALYPSERAAIAARNGGYLQVFR